ncbi:MAG TPA: alkaline phosphatase family protein [Anaerolineales bacterium]|nr:alkaline phosphatase family protein [Anaerolineales bacterium]
MTRSGFGMILLVFQVACATSAPPTLMPSVPSATSTSTPLPPTATELPTITPTVTPRPLVPNFGHIAIIMFENKEFGSVIGNPQMPTYNRLASEYTLLTQYYAIRHPSLPNYIALMGGDTFGIDTNCNDCFIDAPSLPDLIEASGRTWKTYQEDMPEPCFLGSTNLYAQKHNPFIYFDPIRLNPERCARSVVPLTVLQTDIATNSLPNFMFIKPNICNDSHDCSLDVSDAWLTNLLNTLIPALDATGQAYFVAMLFEEGQGEHTCCGLPEPGGGRVPVVLYSPQVKNAFEDPTPYTHYSLLKTISQAWGLPYLGHAADESNLLIIEPWK